ncbi:MAG TPA: diguanylate cyclase [Azospirillaceae bacterium]|nr:diguanylate cyclase [Azospirillaceae bacterium]
MTDLDELFADEAEVEECREPRRPWNVLVVDDDQAVHTVTTFALGSFRFRDRPLALHHAYSAREALEKVREIDDLALILLDVVMETDDAGLRFVKALREEVGNRSARIVLRTGQPGIAPARQVIVDFDINDYKEKTELSSDKLFTTIVSALRSYGDIVALEANRRGLQTIIESSDRLVEETSLRQFAAGVLTQIDALLDLRSCGILCVQRCPGDMPGVVETLAAAGGFAGQEPRSLDGIADAAAADALRRAFDRQRSQFSETVTALYIPVADGHQVAALVQSERPLSDTEQHLLEVFGAKMAASFSNVVLYQRLKRTNAELQSLNETLEARVAERTRALQELNGQLERLATLDPLTGMMNRRRMQELMEEERDRARRYGHSFSVVLMDLDRFKAINDSHGHAAGDVAIRTAAERGAAALRGSDRMARFGGEEFVVLLPETGLPGAAKVAERILSLIRGTPILHDGMEIRLTASAGVAEWAGPEEPLHQMVARADAALYQAKRDGRDRVVVAGT